MNEEEVPTPKDWVVIAVVMGLLLVSALVADAFKKPPTITHSKCYVEATCGEDSNGKPIRLTQFDH